MMPQFSLLGGRPILTVRVSNPINHQSSNGQFLVDTGGEATHLTNAFIQRLGLLPSGETEAWSSNGSKFKAQYIIQIEIPTILNYSTTVAALSFDPLSRIDGLLSLDVLEDLEFYFDGPRNHFTIDKP
jgi:predicted aspartyl protease